MSRKNGHSPSGTWIKTKLELARALGISRPSLDALTCDPGFPEKSARGWPLESCQLFAAKRLNRSEAKKNLDLERLEIETQRSRIALAKEADEVLPVEWVRQVLDHQAICFRRIIEALPISEQDRANVVDQISAIDCDEFLAQLASQSPPRADEN